MNKISFCFLFLSNCLIGNVVFSQVQYPDLVIENESWSTTPAHHFSVPQKIISPSTPNSPVMITNTAQVDFVSGSEVHLSDGFHAGNFSGSGYFNARIGSTLDMAVITPDASHISGNDLHIEKWEKLELGFILPVEYETATQSYLNHYYNWDQLGNPVNPSTDINPYADDSLEVKFDLTSPSGTHIVKYGFFMREASWGPSAWSYTACQDSLDTLVANTSSLTRDYHWRFRFAADEVSSTVPWTFSVTITPASGTPFNIYTFTGFRFFCDPPLPDNHGFLKVNAANNRNMIFDDGTPFFGIGENMADVSHYWHSSPNGFPNLGWLTYYKRDFWDVTNSMNEMSQAGGNYMRMAMFRWLYAIESEHLGVYDRYDDNAPCCNDGTSSNGHQYGNRQYNLWALDQIFNLAREKGIYIQLATDYTYPHSAYQTHFWGNNCYVTNYVYRPNDLPPYDHPEYYLIGPHPDPQVQGSLYYWKRKFKYFSSRWGYAVNIAAYETMGEVDKFLGYTNQNLTNVPGICNDNKVTYSESSAVRTTIYDWHTEIGDYLKNILTDKHMLTVSYTPYGTYHYSGNAAERDFYNLFYHPRIDFIDIHDYDNAQEMFGGSRYDNPSRIGRYRMTNEFVNCNTCPARNGQTYDGLGVDKPFHMGECSTWGNSIDLNPDPDPAETLWTSTSKLYDNYEVSFHNELWATAMMGNFTTGLTWQWHVVHWWPDALHAPLPEGFGPASNELGFVNTINPRINNIPTLVGITNKKVFHNYKQLSEFMNIVNNFFVNNPGSALIPHKTFDPTNGIECYYLLSDDGFWGFGWIHNYYKFWGNSYYGSTLDENYDGCRNLIPSQSFTLDGLNLFSAYDVVFHPTRMNNQVLPNIVYTYTANLPSISVTLNGASLGSDTSYIPTGTSSDFAFILTGSPLRISNHNTSDTLKKGSSKSFNIEVTPNPSIGIFNLSYEVYDSNSDLQIDVFDFTGRYLFKPIKGNKNVFEIDLCNFPKGIYFIRASLDDENKLEKIIVN